MEQNDLIFISAQPYDDYFVWQIEVQIVNFRKFNISSQMHVLVWYPADKNLDKWKILEKKYPEVSFFYYEDKGVNLGLYIPQLRPHILKEHFRKNELSNRIFFYHDSDIIFNYLPDFQYLMEGNVCWQSDTSGYLDYNYLQRKEVEGKIPNNEAIKTLAEIGGITIDIIKSYSDKTGGAQCLLKNIDHTFWEDVEDMVLKIRKAFFFNIPKSINKRYFQSESAGFQSWCADMWALNFSLWKRGIQTDVTNLLDFSWATSSYDIFLQKPIYHNAGATGTQPGVFYKGAWINKSPIGKPINAAKSSASYAYVQLIKEIT